MAELIKNDRDKFDHTIQNQGPSEANKFEVFEKWLLENSAKVPKLELKDYGNEVRGCHTKDDIEEEEIIIEIPLKCLITVEMGKETDIGRAIIETGIDLDAPKHIFLMVYMLLDRKDPHSFFKPYYDILPQTLSNMPIFWNSDELKYLEGSYLIEQIAERNQAIEADYNAICNIFPKFSTISTLDDFKWARMCVCSRNFGLIVNGLQTAALVPYADMLNHYRPRETKWQFDDSLQSFTVVSIQHIPLGAQVYDSYGKKCNHRFLLNYGFSVENNVESDGSCPNETPIYVELKKSDPLYEVKCAYFRRELSIPYRRIRVCISDNENTKYLLAFLRIVEADTDDFNLFSSSLESSLYRSIRDAQYAISLKNELKALKALYRVCQDCLKAYPSTFSEDIERLKDSATLIPFSNERNALVQVKGEKEVLLFFQDLAQVGIQLLNTKSFQEFDEILNDIRINKHFLIFQYCRGTIARLVQEEFRRNDLRGRQTLDLSRPTVV